MKGLVITILLKCPTIRGFFEAHLFKTGPTWRMSWDRLDALDEVPSVPIKSHWGKLKDRRAHEGTRAWFPCQKQLLSLKQWFPSMFQHHLEGLLKHRWLHSIPRISDPVVPGCSPSISTSNNCQVLLMSRSPHFENHWPKRTMTWHKVLLPR